MNIASVCCREFRTFDYCKYAPFVRSCIPKGDGISSVVNLIEMKVLRVGIWLVAMATTVLNAVVMVGRLCFRGENKAHSLVIKNLAGEPPFCHPSPPVL